MRAPTSNAAAKVNIGGMALDQAIQSRWRSSLLDKTWLAATTSAAVDTRPLKARGDHST